MKKTLFYAAMVALCASGLQAHENDHNIKIDGPGLRPRIEVTDDVYMYRRHDDIVIECEDCDQVVTISKQGELFINEEKIRTSRKEKKMLIEYHELANASFESAEKIADEGIKIGMKGAELGIKAATGVFKILLPGYTSKDFERDMEKAAEKVEERANKLEEKADKLEVMMDHLEDLHAELRENITELHELDWF